MTEKSSILVACRRKFLFGDLLLSLILTAIAVIVYESSIWPLSFDITPEAKRALYTTTAAITGSLLGFVIAAITIALALPVTPGSNLLKTSPYYKDVYSTFLSTLRCLGFTTIVSVIPLVVRMEAQVESLYTILFAWLIVLSSLRIARSVWVLGQLVAVATSISSSSHESGHRAKLPPAP